MGVRIPVIRCWNDSERVENVCKTYHRLGNPACPYHRIHEEVIDEELETFVKNLLTCMHTEQQSVTELRTHQALNAPTFIVRREQLQDTSPTGG